MATENELEKEDICKARTDVNAFIEYVMSESDVGRIKQGAIHREWQALADTYDRLVILAPRRHGKTQQFAIGRALFLLGRNPEEKVKILCQSDTKAAYRLSALHFHLKCNPRLREVFPDLTGNSRDYSLEAMGITSSASGDRDSTVMIFDDVVARVGHIELPNTNAKVKAFFNGWCDALLPGGKAIYICTFGYAGDLSHDLLLNPKWSVARYYINPETMGSVVQLPDGTERRSELPLWGDACGGLWSTEALTRHLRDIGKHRFVRGFGNPDDNCGKSAA